MSQHSNHPGRAGDQWGPGGWAPQPPRSASTQNGHIESLSLGALTQLATVIFFAGFFAVVLGMIVFGFLLKWYVGHELGEAWTNYTSQLG